MRRPSVLFINHIYPPARGASGRVLRDLARAFAREGWQVTVVASGKKGGKEKDGGINLVRIKSLHKPAGMTGYVRMWARLLMAGLKVPRTDLVVTLSDPPMLMLAGQIIAKRKKNRHIHWCHDLYPDLLPVLGIKIPQALYKRLKSRAHKSLQKADRVIVIGRCMARLLTAQGIDHTRISFIPNWPDFELVRPPKDEEAAPAGDMAPAAAGQVVTPPKFRVLYAGNIGRAHPTDMIIEAAALLDATHPEIEFVFVGDGPRFDAIARARVQRGLNNIRLMPFQPQQRLRAVMESGDLHLISMKPEAAGLLVPCKIYSALAAGRPTIFIGAAQTEIGKMIEDYKAGEILDPGDPQALADAIVAYRMDGQKWFAAHEGALAASNVFQPKETIEAWMQRAWSVVEGDIKA